MAPQVRAATSEASEAGAALPVIDCDVHQMLRDPAETLFPYLSSGWQEFATGMGKPLPVETSAAMYGQNPFGYMRLDAVPPSGGPAASDPDYVGEHYLTPANVQAAVLTGEGALYVSGLTNPYYAAEVARAYNDHLRDAWLDADPRFKGSIGLSLQVPEWAADEVRRLAGDPDFVQIAVASNPLPYGFGHPIYDPVHRACAETGRPFGIHSLGDSASGSIPSHLASGWPSLYIEYHSGAAQGLMTHLMSFIFHGTFERYPSLKVVLIEPSVSWIPAFLGRLDANFKGLRREIPWCKKAPSEYFAGHVRVTTQPFDAESSDDPVVQGLDALGAEDFLLFSSDYPHWDGDMPTTVLATVPRRWKQKVAFENATALYGIGRAGS